MSSANAIEAYATTSYQFSRDHPEFPKDRTFFRPLLTEKESAKEMLYRITSTMFGMEFQRQMSRKLSVERRTKIIKNLSDPNSRYFETQNPRQNDVLLNLLLIISDFGWNTREKTSREKIRRLQGHRMHRAQ